MIFTYHFFFSILYFFLRRTLVYDTFVVLSISLVSLKSSHSIAMAQSSNRASSGSFPSQTLASSLLLFAAIFTRFIVMGARARNSRARKSARARLHAVQKSARMVGSDDKRLIFLTNRGHGIRAGPVGSPLRSFHLLCWIFY